MVSRATLRGEATDGTRGPADRSETGSGGADGADSARPWLIMMSGSPWRVGSHRQHALARELSAERPGNFRVLFVDPPSNLPSRHFSVTRVDGFLWQATVPTVLPFGRQVELANRVNRSVVSRLLRRRLDQRPGERFLWVDEDLASPLIGHLGETHVVYDATDLDWTFTRPWNRSHLQRHLRIAVAAADVVLTSSTALAAHLPQSRRAPVVVANACDPDVFRPGGPGAPWLESLPSPRIGYIGAVDTRAFDAELVAAVARAHPEWTFVLAGPSTAAGRAPLVALENVHLFDAVPFADVPAAMRSFDVGIIPYRVGELIDYVHPKKCFEYLATGLPVVATPLPALRDLAAPIVLASGATDFGDALAAVLAENDAAALAENHVTLVAAADATTRTTSAADRRAVAQANSWNSRAEQIRPLLTQMGAR